MFSRVKFRFRNRVFVLLFWAFPIQVRNSEDRRCSAVLQLKRLSVGPLSESETESVRVHFPFLDSLRPAALGGSVFWVVSAAHLACLLPRRTGSSPLAARRQRHALLRDSAVDRGRSGGLLPGSVPTQRSQQRGKPASEPEPEQCSGSEPGGVR